jgi:hypothetical protein
MDAPQPLFLAKMTRAADNLCLAFSIVQQKAGELSSTGQSILKLRVDLA